MFDIKDTNPFVTESQSNNNIVSIMTIHDGSSSINIKLNGINYHVWFKILKILRGKKRICYRKKNYSKRRSTFDKWEA